MVIALLQSHTCNISHTKAGFHAYLFNGMMPIFSKSEFEKAIFFMYFFNMDSVSQIYDLGLSCFVMKS